jgi:hypothetical protein
MSYRSLSMGFQEAANLFGGDFVFVQEGPEPFIL